MFVLSRSVLTRLKVDPFALQRSETSGRVQGLIITIKGKVLTEVSVYYKCNEHYQSTAPEPSQDPQIANQDTTSTPDTLLPGTAFLKIQLLVTINKPHAFILSKG